LYDLCCCEQIQVLALMSNVPAVWSRMPTFAATYRSAGWLNLYGIPGWWTRDNSSSSSNTSSNPSSSVARRRRLAEADVVKDVSNCSFLLKEEVVRRHFFDFSCRLHPG
jgi:hypothetical protein